VLLVHEVDDEAPEEGGVLYLKPCSLENFSQEARPSTELLEHVPVM
jgi:hypothetical protein